MAYLDGCRSCFSSRLLSCNRAFRRIILLFRALLLLLLLLLNLRRLYMCGSSEDADEEDKELWTLCRLSFLQKRIC